MLYGHDSLESTGAGGVLLHTSDHGVHEEVVHVLVSLSLASTFNQVDERLNSVSSVHLDLFVDGSHVNVPHVNRQVVTTTSEDVLAVSRSADVSDLVRMGDQTHGLMWVTVEG